MSITRIGVMGVSGRMGRTLVALIDDEYREHCTLTAAASSQTESLDALADADVVIDFSLPDGTLRLVRWIREHRRSAPFLVSGTTGLTDAELEELRSLGEWLPVLHANNFSLGLAAFEAALGFAAPLFESLGYTPVITETHHAGKKDAPSGTALTLRQTLRPDTPESVQTHSVRAGSIIGEHQVRFHGADDDITMSHTALSRSLFARGALEAALWLRRQPRDLGFLTMRDYFNTRFLNRER